MALGDIFKAKQYKESLEDLTERHKDLEQEIVHLKSLVTPEMRDAEYIKSELLALNTQKESLKKQIESLDNVILEKHQNIYKLEGDISSLKSKIIWMDDEILVQDFGLYQPKYDFENSEKYKIRLSLIRNNQKELIKSKKAATGDMHWTVNNNATKGKKMVSDMQKLLLRAFNSECDELINKVKYNNFDASLKRISSSRDAISKLGTIMNVGITYEYYNSKIEELQLALEYQIKKQEEKEALKEARSEMREAARLQKEIEEQKRKFEKEQTHYQKALLTVLKQLESADASVKQELIDKSKELEAKLGDIEISLKDIDYREANQKAGYVYIISNLGAFGENVYKIGMTRRLEPQERVDELGDASVPYNFDVHAMIFSDNAPQLENALHKAFEDRKLNMVNKRREFFNVTLDEIKQVIANNFDKTVEFVDVPEAEQYRISKKMRATT